MKITFILKNLSDAFYNGSEFLGVGLLQLQSNKERWERLKDIVSRRELDVKMMVGNSDSFRDKVDLNTMLRMECSFQFKLEPRKGYKLATFEIEPVKQPHSV